MGMKHVNSWTEGFIVQPFIQFGLTLFLLLGLSGCGSSLVPPLLPTPVTIPIETTPVATATGATLPPTAMMLLPSDTPPPAKVALPTDVYPAALPVSSKVTWNVGQGCPNPAGLQEASMLSVDVALDVLNQLFSGDLNKMRQVTDQAYWPLLAAGGGRTEPIPQDWISVPQPARDSPYANLIANACGQDTLDKSWWVKYCAGPCKDARSMSLIGNFYFIQRAGHWLMWATP